MIKHNNNTNPLQINGWSYRIWLIMNYADIKSDTYNLELPTYGDNMEST